jgi:transposase-like protein
MVETLSAMLTFMDTLALRLKAAFDDSGTSVSTAAQECGVSVQAVYKWLNGQTDDLEGRHLVIVSQLTSHDPAWLEFGTPPKIRTYATSKTAATVLKAMEQMNDTQRAAIENMALTLINSQSPDDQQAA